MNIKKYFILVKIARLLIFSLLILSLATLFIFPLINSYISKKSMDVLAQQEGLIDLGMSAPVYRGIDDSLRPFKLIAKRAVNQGKDEMLLFEPRGLLKDKQNKDIKISSVTGLVLTDKNILHLHDNVELLSEQYDVHSIYAKVDLGKQTVEGNKGVLIKAKTGSTTADKYKIDTARDILYFYKNPVVKVENKKKGETTTIASKQATILQQENKAIFVGDVVVTKPDMVLKADKMTAFYEESSLSGREKTIRKVEMNENVELITNDEQIKGDRGIYMVKEDIVTVYDNVELYRDKNILRGDKLVYDVKTSISNLLSKQGYKVRVEVDDIGNKQNKKNEQQEESTK